VVFAIIHRYAGLAGVGFITTLLLSLVSLLVYRLALRISHNNAMSILVTVLTVAVSNIHWLARPHLVSWIFLLAFLNCLESARAGHKNALYLLPLLMIFWVNLHAGFVAGLVTITCFAVGEAATVLLQSTGALNRARWRAAWAVSAPYWASLALCTAATLVNPYGFQLDRHVFNYLTDSELLDKIQEFQSISFHAGPAVFFEIMLLLAVCVVFDKLRHLQMTPVLLIVLWAHFALLSARHIPLFMFVAAPLVAALLSSALESKRAIPVLSGAVEAIRNVCQDLRVMEFTPRLPVTSAAALLVIAGLFALGRAPFAPEFDPESFPAQAIPMLRPYAGSRIFTTDQWADYLLYRMYPAQRVFFDGRSDFYGNDFVKINQRILSAEHDWKALLQHYAISLVVIKPETPLSAVLKLTPGARVLFDDGQVIVFDTNGIAQLFPGKRDTVKRTPGSSQTPSSDVREVVSTGHRPTSSPKGNPS
jgi:hypothetical protein